jgi:hypothetical protein
VLHQDRHLVWSVAPLLKRELTPPRSHWGELGLLHPPPPSLVLAHGLTISAEAPDAWPYPEDPAELVVGSIWAFHNELRRPTVVVTKERRVRCVLCLQLTLRAAFTVHSVHSQN